MKIIPQTQQELGKLVEQFSQLEESTGALEVAPPETLVVVRADGIKHSKHFLKDSLENPAYHTALREAIGKTYPLWRNWAPEKCRPYLLGALRLSDEVSLIVNRGENYYQRRLLKMTTTLASTLSGAMSLEFAAAGHSGPGAPPIMAFDGRALVMREVGEFESYIRCRRLLFARNAMARVLRVTSSLSDAELYGGGEEKEKLASDIYRLSREIDSRALWPEYERAAGGSALYVADVNGNLEGFTLASDPGDDEAVQRALRTLDHHMSR